MKLNNTKPANLKKNFGHESPKNFSRYYSEVYKQIFKKRQYFCVIDPPFTGSNIYNTKRNPAQKLTLLKNHDAHIPPSHTLDKSIVDTRALNQAMNIHRLNPTSISQRWEKGLHSQNRYPRNMYYASKQLDLNVQGALTNK